MPRYPVRGNSIPLPGWPRWLVKPYQESAFLATPGDGAPSVTGHDPIHRATPPPPEGRRGGFRADTAPRGRPPVKADRRVHAAPYPANANANTLTVHTVTPAIVIWTVCCHMVSIPHFGLTLSGTLDQHNTARSDGRHRRYFSRHGAKYKMPRTGGAGGNSCLRVHSTARRKGHPDPRQKVSGLSAGRRAAPWPGPCTRFPPSTRRGGRRSPVRRAPGARPASSRWFFRSCRPGFSCSKPAPDTGPRP